MTEVLPRYRAVLIGCGLGSHAQTFQFVRDLLEAMRALREVPALVLDADGLNALAGLPLAEVLSPHTILTPHAGELARLAQQPVEALEADRLKTARHYAKAWQCVLVAKGAPCIVAEPGGRAFINPYRNPALASAGTGDVLAGTIVGLLSQGAAPLSAAVAGAYIHGEAGAQVSTRVGTSGLLASDLLSEIPVVVHRLRQASPSS